MNFAVIIPTYNPGKDWLKSVSALTSQQLKSDEVLIIDSESRDDCVSISVDAGFHVKTIEQQKYDHGGTRNFAVEVVVELSPDCEFVIFLTQDAALVDDDSLEKILAPFRDKDVAAVCGRQLPGKSASLIEAHARLYNYTEESVVRSIHDKGRFGLKTAFLSNSFSAYRLSVFNDVGGFPEKVIFAEDMFIATKMLQAGYKVAYAADACVYHSHRYSIWQEMQRYFDMGVFHAREPWVRKELGAAEGEAIKFVFSELKYLLRHAFWRIPEGLLRTLLRYSGFRLGLMEKNLPLTLKRRLAMNKGYFVE